MATNLGLRWSERNHGVRTMYPRCDQLLWRKVLSSASALSSCPTRSLT